MIRKDTHRCWAKQIRARGARTMNIEHCELTCHKWFPFYMKCQAFARASNRQWKRRLTHTHRHRQQPYISPNTSARCICWIHYISNWSLHRRVDPPAPAALTGSPQVFKSTEAFQNWIKLSSWLLIIIKIHTNPIPHSHSTKHSAIIIHSFSFVRVTCLCWGQAENAFWYMIVCNGVVGSMNKLLFRLF